MSREITPNWMLATRLREVEAERDGLRDALAQQRKFCPECGAAIFPHVPAEPYRPGSEGE